MNKLPVIALQGDTWSTPASTIDALWSALGAGADALALSVYLSKDNHLVCTPALNLKTHCGCGITVDRATLADIQACDAGALFRSTVLNDDWQPTGERGDDTPWEYREQEGRLKERKAVCYPTLDLVLQIFSRRTRLFLLIHDEGDKPDSIVEPLLHMLSAFGLQSQVSIAANDRQYKLLHDAQTPSQLLLDVRGQNLDAVNLDSFAEHRNGLLCYAEALLTQANIDSAFCTTLQNLELPLVIECQTMPFAPTPEFPAELEQLNLPVKALLTRGTLPTVSVLSPWSEMFNEQFSGNTINERFWRAGYSHINAESTLRVDDGLIIEIREGSQYSGAAAGCTLPIHGDFDVQVDFDVDHPHQATTFEIAAIGIDPGYHHMEHEGLNSRTANLTFDVHGAPPYASSERDQNDGFRCGWNNSYNLTRVESNYHASSVNMYNKYGRDVGDGSANNPSGSLRLTRHGQVFNTYYRDKHNAAWVCSGTMLVQSMPQDCFVRLALKHWDKLFPEPAPHNRVRFSNFVLRQKPPTFSAW